jgi:hypothetical protein
MAPNLNPDARQWRLRALRIMRPNPRGQLGRPPAALRALVVAGYLGSLGSASLVSYRSLP